MSYWILFIVALVFSAEGFYSYIYFFSIGYGFAIAAIGATLAILFRAGLGGGEFLACLLLIIYGVRLGGYILLREIKSKAYKKILSPELDRSKRMPMVAKLSIWISCAILYTLETSPLYFRLLNGAKPDAMLYVGLAVMALGIILEAASDYQKSQAKKANPYTFVSTGLFKFVRCPNYLGELILWLGMLLLGCTAMHGPLQWGMALLGFALILYIMFSGARRLEIRQDKNYGEDPKYVEYKNKVPILLPFLPIYSVKKHTWLKA